MYFLGGRGLKIISSLYLEFRAEHSILRNLLNEGGAHVYVSNNSATGINRLNFFNFDADSMQLKSALVQHNVLI
jgi:hypothetical protein